MKTLFAGIFAAAVIALLAAAFVRSSLRNVDATNIAAEQQRLLHQDLTKVAHHE